MAAAAIIAAEYLKVFCMTKSLVGDGVDRAHVRAGTPKIKNA
jgi:hypothetical protein